jgi:serine/threonine protein phosphatase 1
MTKTNDLLYAIGDVHGRSDLLSKLLGRIAADATDRGIVRPRLIMLGDLGDRGHDSRGVYDLLSSPAFISQFEARFILGNHDAWLLEAIRRGRDNFWLRNGGPGEWLRNGGAELVESYGYDFRRSPALVIPEFAATFPSAHRAVLESASLYVEEDGYLFVHAGVDPSAPLDRDPDALLWIRESFLVARETGPFTVVHGHTPFQKVTVETNRIGVDTGCGHGPGRPLSAVGLAPGGGPPVVILDSSS